MTDEQISALIAQHELVLLATGQLVWTQGDVFDVVKQALAAQENMRRETLTGE